MSIIVGPWRRSIRLRVVVSTVVLSSIVIFLVGWLLMRTVAHGLAENKRDSALAEATAGIAHAQSLLEASEGAELMTQSQVLSQFVDDASARRRVNKTFDVIIEGPLSTEATPPVRSSGSLTLEEIPKSLREGVSSHGETAWQYMSVRTANESIPAVAVGGTAGASGSGNEYALYYVFRMDTQTEALALMQRTLLAGGVIMVLLIGGVVHLVSRQVVDPLRLARGIAERLAAGNLEQRMHVKGEDDIASLSRSFNQMAESLQSQIHRLEELSRLQQRFVSDVSHELRTPLTTVQMAAQMIHQEREAMDATTARAAELLRAELERFENLLADLLDLSRFDAGAATLELDPVDMVTVARQALENPSLVRSGIAGRYRGMQVPAIVEADIRRIDRVVRNLINNAVKYSESDRIDVLVAANGECVSLAVRDYGVGVPPSHVRQMFDRFWRGDPARPHGGTGLGLAIAREDALLHGGTLEVFSKVGHGTEFILTIPKPGCRLEHPAIRSVFI